MNSKPLTIDELIERAKSDVAFWTRRYKARPTSYNRLELMRAEERQAGYEWRKENPRRE